MMTRILVWAMASTFTLSVQPSPGHAERTADEIAACADAALTRVAHIRRAAEMHDEFLIAAFLDISA